MIWLGKARRPTRLEGAEGDRLVDPEAANAQPEDRERRGSRRLQKIRRDCRGGSRGASGRPRRGVHDPLTSPRIEADIAMGVGAHRRAPDRARPSPLRSALCHHLCLSRDRRMFLGHFQRRLEASFEALLAAFAQEAGADRDRIIVLVLDNAGWHIESNLAVPDGIRLVFLPPAPPSFSPQSTLGRPPTNPASTNRASVLELRT